MSENENLHDYSQYIDCPEPKFELHTILAEDSADFRELCTDIIYQIINRSKDVWIYYTWDDSIYKILENGIKSGNQQTKYKVKELADKIGRLGGKFLKFGDLLYPNQ